MTNENILRIDIGIQNLPEEKIKELIEDLKNTLQNHSSTEDHYFNWKQI